MVLVVMNFVKNTFVGLNNVGCDLACQFSFEIRLPEGTEWDWKDAILCMKCQY